jgi:multicomponent Na+:H+ antiporter subunit G
MLEYAGFVFLSLGTLFFLISAIGLLRMPDIYTRMHVGTKSTTIATLLIVIGACFLEPAWSFKLLLIAVFILLTNPLSSSVIARAAHKDAQKLELDEYKEEE